VASKLAAQGFTPKPMSPDGVSQVHPGRDAEVRELIKTNHVTLE
jgi:hypothetical protein